MAKDKGPTAVTDSYTQDAFGKQLSSSGSTVNPYRYGGEWGYETEGSGLQQLGARFYWPEIGRFVSQDPIGDGINWYAYVGNNPVGYIDPEGLHETTSTLHNMFHGDGSSWCAAKQGLRAFADGVIPFADPFKQYYDNNDPFLQASKTMGWVTRDAMVAAAAAPTGIARQKNAGGVEAWWGKNFRVGWHKFETKAGRVFNRIHYHRRGPGGIGSHRPWQGKW